MRRAIVIVLFLSCFVTVVLLPSCNKPMVLNNDIIRLDKSAIVNGSIYTNGTWQYIGRIQIPSNFVAGPFRVQ